LEKLKCSEFYNTEPYAKHVNKNLEILKLCKFLEKQSD